MSIPQSAKGIQPPTPRAILQQDATLDEGFSSLPVPRRYSEQCYAVAAQIQAHCLARNRDVGLTAAQWHALHALQAQYAALDARISLNTKIATVLHEYQAELSAAVEAHPFRILGTAWRRYRAAYAAFGARLDATHAAMDALHSRYLDYLTDVLASLEREGRP